jgi:hypothetical protein
MTEVALKYSLGMFMVFSHAGVIFYVFVLFAIHGFDFGQFTTLLAIIIPMLAGYTTSIVSFIIRDRHRLSTRSKQVTTSFAVLSFFFPSVFLIAIVIIVALQAFSLVFDNFENFKATLVLIEGAFAVYVGKFIVSLFEPSVGRSPQKPAGSGLPDQV